MNSFLALQIVHIIACHTVSNPLSTFPCPAAKQNIPINTKGSGCTTELNPNHLYSLYHNPHAKGHISNKWLSNSIINGHHKQSIYWVSKKIPRLKRFSFVDNRPKSNCQVKTTPFICGLVFVMGCSEKWTSNAMLHSYHKFCPWWVVTFYNKQYIWWLCRANRFAIMYVWISISQINI
jgi:hypothetical protein